MKKIILVLVLSLSMVAVNAFAKTYTFDYGDNWWDWDSISGGQAEAIGSPMISGMDVVVSTEDDVEYFLQSVTINMENRRVHDSLFISTDGRDSGVDLTWDYLVHDGGQNHGSTLANGLHTVKDAFAYTISTESVSDTSMRNASRNTEDYKANVNGLTYDSLEQGSLGFNDFFNISVTGTGITYNLSSLELDVSNGFYLAYSPWCANDVIGAGTPSGHSYEPVPEPATMLLLGSGLLGLAFYRRKMKK